MKLLLIIDPQYDFIEGGTLPVTGGKHALDAVVENLKTNIYDYTYITLDNHPDNHCSFDLWPVHCVAGTHGNLIYENIIKYINTVNAELLFKGENINEDEYSIFSPNNEYGKKLNNKLKNLKDFNIYVCGLAGDYCVLNTIKDLIRLGFKDNITVLKDCIASIDGGTQLNNLIESEKLKTI